MMSIPPDNVSSPYSADDSFASDGDRILVPIVTDKSSLVRSIALDIADGTQSELVLAVLETSKGRTDGEDSVFDERSKAGQGSSSFEAVPTSTVTGSGRTVVDALEDAVRGQNVGTIVLANEQRGESASLFHGGTTARLVSRTGSNVLVVTEVPSQQTISSILVPVGGGPYSRLAISVAKVMAQTHDAWIDLYHVVGPDCPSERRHEAERYVQTYVNQLGDFERVDTWIHEAPSVSEAIIEQTAYYDLTVLGSPTKGRLRRFLFGSTTDDVETEAQSTIVTVRGP